VDSGAVVIIVQQLLLVLVEEALSKLLFCVLELFCSILRPLVRLVFLVGVSLVWCAQLECLGGC